MSLLLSPLRGPHPSPRRHELDQDALKPVTPEILHGVDLPSTTDLDLQHTTVRYNAAP